MLQNLCRYRPRIFSLYTFNIILHVRKSVFGIVVTDTGIINAINISILRSKCTESRNSQLGGTSDVKLSGMVEALVSS